ncbi:MAG: hypothetical protein WKF83_17570 [Nocardioidaceae bacterium]
MIVVGVVLLLLVLAVAITLITSGNDPTSFSLLGISIDTSARNVYLLGAFSLLLAVVALDLIRRGVHRSREISKENKTLRKEVKASRKSVAAPLQPVRRTTTRRIALMPQRRTTSHGPATTPSRTTSTRRPGRPRRASS